ncbi:asparagine synthase (glutamine-hydrolyzing) [Dasania sp. GY-MA-18]|uniref:asparagine synthase (glutamine-hydrolyzing) n=1 Tax=Dasania phycosphaerae TaxID=2950436 RepID=A0A9J6RQB1_9GAMM|nr:MULTISPECIES: asparagine synthase (glutamine-hydrolyzing) [Dasania]MCR8924119.1 asparagine synthase (glutamine-hydrolyzing) [Dasania sp. GY-MA-18]MCZ0866692.1 asparagine synthase (glutamine-hydrolyzing) [Dasania phycosphaerae]MCZ0870277.1 asparagine synthase (glutamine-hydrolyzing) [Dasania phycosphaerae]
MCGIAGFTRFHSPTGDSNTLVAMGNAIAHRGPDAHGEYLDERIGLCHRRLSIIDLSAAGNQPMYSSDNNIVLVFNGEIYNFQELREELQAEGYQFKTHTDTEVIIALYLRDGKNCIKQLNGMFAIALWDKQQQTLLLARDRLGKKPLYYFQKDDRFVFGSEIKAILEVNNIPKVINQQAVYDYFSYQYVPDPKTIFQDIYKLKPGHMMTVDQNGQHIEEYWDVSFAHENSLSEEENFEQLYQQLNHCTQQRMVSDVPLGAFLSGGVDSSGIVGLMAKNSDKPVTTCSIGFDSEKFDEVKYAKQVAELFNTDHHEFTVKSNVRERLEHIASFFDEPFADPSLVPTYFVSELARQQVTVALAGDGGDESFAGYNKYHIDNIENRLRNLFPGFIRHTIFPPLAKASAKINHRLFKKASTLLNTLSKDAAHGFYMTNAFMSDDTWNQLVNEQTKATLAGYHPSSITESYYHKSDGNNHLAKILYTDIKTYLTGDILVKVDRMSMANSLEVRAPILDHKVIELAAQMPAQLKYNNGEKKYALKKTFAKLLPKEILYRKKMGFSVPLAEWLRDEIKDIAEQKLLNKDSGLSQFFKVEAINSLWQQHQNKQRDYSSELWSMLMFELWWQRYMNNEHTNG